mgnify:FL=1
MEYSAPVPYSDSMNQKSIRQLIDSGLIQRDYESMFIPYHDIYTVIYKWKDNIVYPITAGVVGGLILALIVNLCGNLFKQ